MSSCNDTSESGMLQKVSGLYSLLLFRGKGKGKGKSQGKGKDKGQGKG